MKFNTGKFTPIETKECFFRIRLQIGKNVDVIFMDTDRMSTSNSITITQNFIKSSQYVQKSLQRIIHMHINIITQ